jgi:hypothetical protein
MMKGRMLVACEDSSTIDGNIVIKISPPLNSDPSSDLQNVNTNIIHGMMMKVAPSHRCTILWGNPEDFPLHIAGNIGQSDSVLTVTGTDDPDGLNITKIFFSSPGLSNDPGAIKEGDKLYFIHNIPGFVNVHIFIPKLFRI